MSYLDFSLFQSDTLTLPSPKMGEGKKERSASIGCELIVREVL